MKLDFANFANWSMYGRDVVEVRGEILYTLVWKP